ncbi:DUF4112 domain-containing protein [Marinobacter sp. X15-166B]|uniref:DUF4112 domain-containing protein n=1 Tax=Marinobacter sp. X15-166B TaxID=1897620 RepID=UPI00085C7D6A|nr:DUF4112 domain-containing protein [Marinobacter sp. X15-166B]OEY65301.1 hypothetical protein BG841_01705 [Marinobacter sp. X15-166B]
MTATKRNSVAAGAGEQARYAQALARLEQRARLLDSQFRIPFTRIRFGLDPLIGLLPGIGDLAGLLLSLHLVVEAVRLGAGTGTVMRMLANVLLESVVGLIPVAGDAFDVYWKANSRNAALLRTYLHQQLTPAPPRRRWLTRGLLVVLAGLVVVLLGLAGYSLWGQG